MYAKTLYKPDFPKEIGKDISKFTNEKLPAFFEFAKDKRKSQVKERNDSFVNKLYNKFPNKPINTRGLKLGKLDYFKLMHNVNTVCPKEVSNLYDELNKEYRYMLNLKDEYTDNLHYVACEIRRKFAEFGYSDEEIADMLVQYLYKNKKRYKQILWFCYGRIVVENLKNNVEIPKTKYIQCVDCGEWIEVSTSSRKIRCDECSRLERKRHNREMYQKRKIQPS